MRLTIITLDFETFYSDEYSLRKMTPLEYICDARFETIGASFRKDEVTLPYTESVKTFGAKSVWLNGPDLPRLFSRVDWSKTALMSHNIGFDGAILAWRYGIVPALYIDTLGMSRAAAPHAGRASLDAMLKYIEAPPKGDAIHNAKNWRLADFMANPGFFETYKTYANRDCDGCFWLFEALAHYFSGVSGVSTLHKNEEFLIMDTVARMAILPQLSANRSVLYAHLKDVVARKEKLIDRMRDSALLDAKDERKTFQSNEAFANLLRALGVDPPTKISMTTGKETYAFSKQDKDFTDLLEHEDDLVQAAVVARLGVKSTLEETRSQRFINISVAQWPVPSDATIDPALAKGADIIPPRMPFPLKYSGAHTHRLCLVGHTEIYVLRDTRCVCIRLDALRADDLVWDGDFFVPHGGLVRAGVKRVITHDGITGTPDHRVWTLEYGYIGLAEAKARGTSIACGGIPDPTRVQASMRGGDSISNESPVYMREMRGGEARFMERPHGERACVVQILRGEGQGVRKEVSDAWYEKSCTEQHNSIAEGFISPQSLCCSRTDCSGVIRNSTVQGKAINGEVARGAVEYGAAYLFEGSREVPQSKHANIQVLWGERDFIRVSDFGRYGGLDFDKSRPATTKHDFGQNRCEWALRAGELTVGGSPDADEEPQFMETWDIVNCGPRNRFMANGKVVHNSGDWSLNLQNLGRKSRLRESLVAPPGYKIVSADASQIEARVVSWLAGCEDIVQAFANKEDVYSTFASAVYGFQVNKYDHPGARFTGKTAVLGLGFSMGITKFKETCRVQGRAQGLPPEMYTIDIELAERTVKTYRSRYKEIPAYWKLQETAIEHLAMRQSMQIGVLYVDGPSQSIVLPNGMRLWYTNMRKTIVQRPGEQPRAQWVFDYGNRTKYTFGGKQTENCVQALARIITMNAATRIRRYGRIGSWRPKNIAGQIHDQLIYVAPNEYADELLALVIEEMSKPLDWFSTLPLAAEGGIGDNLLEIK